MSDTGSQVSFSSWLPEFPDSITNRHGEENTRKPLDIHPWPCGDPCPPTGPKDGRELGSDSCPLQQGPGMVESQLVIFAPAAHPPGRFIHGSVSSKNVGLSLSCCTWIPCPGPRVLWGKGWASSSPGRCGDVRPLQGSPGPGWGFTWGGICFLSLLPYPVPSLLPGCRAL